MNPVVPDIVPGEARDIDFIVVLRLYGGKVFRGVHVITRIG